MREALMSKPAGKPWLVATGALTNVALLFATFPEVADHVRGLSIMGGAIGEGYTSAPLGNLWGEGERFGNYTPWAEFNIYVCARRKECRSLVMAHGWKLKLDSVTRKLLNRFSPIKCSLERRR